jgi:uncharacterized membrane protein
LRLAAPQVEACGYGCVKELVLRRTLAVLLILLALLALAALGWWLAGMPKVAFDRPWLLLALVAVPVLILWSVRRVATLGPVRGWLALGLRSAILAALILALAGIQSVHEEDSLTVLVVIDRSYSIPQELENVADATRIGSIRDLRWERLAEALRASTSRQSHRRDRVGVISFGRKPRLEFPAASLPELNIKELSTVPDRTYTDIAAAIRLALASFPEGTARRILLITDGNENRGDALKEASVAQLNHVPIDVVPVKYEFANEIIVDRIDAPTETQEGRELPLAVVIRNYTNARVPGMLTLWRIAGAKSDKAQQPYTLQPGLNKLQLRWPGETRAGGGAITYRAVFQPESLRSDRPDNNEAWAPILVKGEGRKVLLITPEGESPDVEPLLRAIGNVGQRPGEGGRKKYDVDVWNATQVPSEKDARAHELANYDCVLLYNIPADHLRHEQQEALRKNTRDQGAGMVVIGGKESFGAGRWQGEPLEEAFPVNTSLQGLKVQSKGGLVLIMHATEMADGNHWQKEIARLALNKMTPQDEVGVIYWNWSNHTWHVPLQQIGPNRSSILNQIATMSPGDMPQFDPAVSMAHSELVKPERGLSAKHVILISDGDHGLLGDFKLLDRYARDKVTLTTVGVTTHGPAAQAALAKISTAARGRHYAVNDPQQLPSIYIKETRLISQNFLFERPFTARLYDRGDPLREWTREFPLLHGYVRTQRKESALVQNLLLSPLPGDDLNPLLAQWQYGLGRVVAFTSDAGGGEKSWARDWARDEGGLYTDFWTRVVDWAIRNVDDSGLSVLARHENGKLRVTLLDNRDKQTRADKPLSGLKVTVASSGSKDNQEPVLDPVSAGVFEAVVDAEAAGSYSIAVSRPVTIKNPQGQDETVTQIVGRSALAVPYSPEFATVRSNDGLLLQLAQSTHGRVIDEAALASTDLFSHDLPPTRDLQPIWFWLVFLAAVLLLFDVMVRRIAIQPAAIAAKAGEVYRRFRGQARLSAESQSYFERLKSKKTDVGEKLEKAKATARFEGTAEQAALATDGVKPPRPVSQPERVDLPARPAAATESRAAAPALDDFAARLMKAKQKAREQIEGDKEPGA